MKTAVLHEMMNANIKLLTELVKINWDFKKAHIYPIKLKENQLQDLDQYLMFLEE